MEYIEKRLDEIKINKEKKIQKQLEELAFLTDQNRILDPLLFFEYGLSDYIPKKGKIIAVDLEKMKTFLYEDGVLIESANVLSKGKKGSRWETPSGLYEIMTKEEKHLSSLGGVYMPYSMQFFGNFFIHGWPYYPNGLNVESGYSGGCIRLSTESARKIFNFVDVGTEIFVYEGQENKDISVTTKIRNIPKPVVTAKSVIVADIKNNNIYYKKDSDILLPIASITKLMTALVSNETISFGKKIIVRDHVQYIGDYAGNVKDGDMFYSEHLIYPLLMESNNAVAHSLSAYYGDIQFMIWMNKKAKSLGLYDTKFDDASGISSSNVSTAEDLFRLTKYLYEKQSFVLNISKSKNKKLTSLNGTEYVFHNFNIFSEDKNFVGGKTGFTNAAGETMVSVFDVSVDEATSTIAIIILGSEDRENDIKKLKQWFSVAAVSSHEISQRLSYELFQYLGTVFSRQLLSSMIFWKDTE